MGPGNTAAADGHEPGTVHLAFLAAADLNAVAAIEQQGSPDPWTLQNFRDALAAGYWMQGAFRGAELIAYCVALEGGPEVHLLTIAVAPAFQRQGWAAVLLQALRLRARTLGAEAVWLEVRAGNQRAQHVYARAGFRPVGRRRNYYRAAGGAYEDAILMTWTLAAAAPVQGQ